MGKPRGIKLSLLQEFSYYTKKYCNEMFNCKNVDEDDDEALKFAALLILRLPVALFFLKTTQRLRRICLDILYSVAHRKHIFFVKKFHANIKQFQFKKSQWKQFASSRTMWDLLQSDPQRTIELIGNKKLSRHFAREALNCKPTLNYVPPTQHPPLLLFRPNNIQLATHIAKTCQVLALRAESHAQLAASYAQQTSALLSVFEVVL